VDAQVGSLRIQDMSRKGKFKKIFNPKTTNFKCKTPRSTSYRGLDKIWLRFVHIRAIYTGQNKSRHTKDLKGMSNKKIISNFIASSERA
jgi:hypothetical protein